ncbi:hypothetical protein Tcan_10882 [Toxocara canis]|uniref:Uncharacterized protein n=1 Tax=Toxocara canis TaxID=6265 RepID=A0A0B2W4G3_TOXCA|nr:hypothetical protein Tcan_10882 [Toxocara canis]
MDSEWFRLAATVVAGFPMLIIGTLQNSQVSSRNSDCKKESCLDSSSSSLVSDKTQRKEQSPSIEEKTQFERVNAKSRPARSKIHKKSALKWKSGDAYIASAKNRDHHLKHKSQKKSDLKNKYKKQPSEKSKDSKSEDGTEMSKSEWLRRNRGIIKRQKRSERKDTNESIAEEAESDYSGRSITPESSQVESACEKSKSSRSEDERTMNDGVIVRQKANKLESTKHEVPQLIADLKKILSPIETKNDVKVSAQKVADQFPSIKSSSDQNIANGQSVKEVEAKGIVAAVIASRGNDTTSETSKGKNLDETSERSETSEALSTTSTVDEEGTSTPPLDDLDASTPPNQLGEEQKKESNKPEANSGNPKERAKEEYVFDDDDETACFD